MIRFAAWLGRTLARKFVLLLIGFLLLQGAQLVAAVVGNRHLGEEGALINDAGRQRMRTLRLANLTHQAVAAGSWTPGQRQLFDITEPDYEGFFASRLAAFVEGRAWIEELIDAERQAPVRDLLAEAQRAWQQELKPLLHAVDPARPQAARRLLARYEQLASVQIARLDRAVTMLENDARYFSRALAGLQTVILGFSLILGIAGLVMARVVVARPLRALNAAAGAIADGAYDRRLTASSHDELGALANAFNRMASAIEQRTHGIEVLNRAAVAVTSSLSSPEIVAQVLRHAVELTGLRAASVVFHDPSQGRFTDWHTTGLSEPVGANLAFHPDGLVDEAFTRGEPVLCSNHAQARHKLSARMREAGIRSCLCLPLVSHAGRLGVLCVYRDDADTFTADETGLLSAFARLAAQAFENARLHTRTEAMAVTDVLTGLHNRRWLDGRLQEEVQRSQRFGKPLSVLMLDVDHFKRINDRYGHPAGDVMLRRLAEVVQNQLREVDAVARYGGEELAVMFPETEGAFAKQGAERIRRAIAGTSFELPGGQSIGATVSIGVACYPGCAADAAMLIERADQALYVAKQDGRNRVVLYREMLTAEIEKDPNRIVVLLQEDIRNIESIVTAVAAKGVFYRGHTELVGHTALQLAEALKLPPSGRESLRLASQLHDIGMVVIPDAVLNKKTPLTAEEWQKIRAHPAVAAQLLEQVPALRHIAPVVRHHHERWDGGGYPDGLRGEAIPYLARVLAVADAYGSMVSDWPGHQAELPAVAAHNLRASAGTQLDPEIANILIKVLASGQASATGH